MRVFILALILLWGTPAFSQTAQPDPEKLESLTKAEDEARRAEAELSKKRRTIQGEIGDLKKQLVKTASEASRYEKESIRLERKLSELDKKETILKEQIYGDRQTLMTLLAALQRIENNPPPPLAVRPKDAAEAARAEILMSSLSEDLHERADMLRQRLVEAQSIREDINSKYNSLSANTKNLSQRRNKISALVKKKTGLEKSVSRDQIAASQRVKKLASEAKTLRDLIDAFEAEALKVTPRVKPEDNNKNAPKSVASLPVKLPKGVKKFSTAKGKLNPPISGSIVSKYGRGEKGLTLGGPSSTQVLAPYAGRVEFAGAFKNYDNVVIINVGENYFILLTGLGETYVETGEDIKTGEPLGLLPFMAQGTANLYIEIRKNGTTIDPNPWFDTILSQ